MSLGVANVSESMSSDAVPYTCSARRPRCRPARAALGARRAQAAGGAGAHQALLAQRRALRLRLGRRLRARRPRWSAARSRAGGGRGACGAGAHLDDRHAHEPQQAPALLVVLACHAHGALAVLCHVRLAAGLRAGALGRPAGLRSARAPARRRRAARAHLLRLLQRLGGRVAALRPGRPRGHRVSLPPGARSRRGPRERRRAAPARQFLLLHHRRLAVKHVPARERGAGQAPLLTCLQRRAARLCERGAYTGLMPASSILAVL